jgi:hypothetical protein
MTIEVKTSSLTDADIARAKEIWRDYQQTHDVTALRGQAAGIDPTTGEVWLGEDILDIYEQRLSKGLTSPLFFERIGYRTYIRKGARR